MQKGELIGFGLRVEIDVEMAVGIVAQFAARSALGPSLRSRAASVDLPAAGRPQRRMSAPRGGGVVATPFGGRAASAASAKSEELAASAEAFAGSSADIVEIDAVTHRALHGSRRRTRPSLCAA